MKYGFTSCFRKPLAVSFFFLLFFAGDIFSQDRDTKKPGVQKVFYGQASFYANKFAGRKTASGEIFSQNKMTCACNAVKIGTWLRVTNVRTKKSVLVKVNDRIHPRMKRVVDLSSGAAKKIGITSSNGVGRVKVEVLGTSKPAE
jgi:rare lipoprotein A